MAARSARLRARAAAEEWIAWSTPDWRARVPLEPVRCRGAMAPPGECGGHKPLKTIVVTPDPALLESMRSIGYTVEAAVADVIDNSVAAEADKS